MPQTPSSSLLCKLWVDHLQKHASIILGQPSSWPAEVCTLQGHTSSVYSVGYSLDGRHIVSGSHDKTIRVWNVTTGECVAGPFLGHEDSVWSVAYSPDGRHIISGSDDKTFRVWNATTGECVAGPFLGHEHSVTSVVYSPDGRHIVSGSGDKTIRIWDAITGQCAAGPFHGHTDFIWSVAFSPDGRHIVSCSSDRTIKIWKTDSLLSFGYGLYYKDGWLQSSDSSCFGWITPWSHPALCLPCHSLVISDSTYQLDVDLSLYGESWVSCWK